MNKNVQEISSPATKAVIFLYACGKLSGPIPQVVFQLINRWAAIPCKIFTDHVEFVNWMLKIPEGHVCQEVKPAMVVVDLKIQINLYFLFIYTPAGFMAVKQLGRNRRSLHASKFPCIPGNQLKSFLCTLSAIPSVFISDSRGG